MVKEKGYPSDTHTHTSYPHSDPIKTSHLITIPTPTVKEKGLSHEVRSNTWPLPASLPTYAHLNMSNK